MTRYINNILVFLSNYIYANERVYVINSETHFIKKFIEHKKERKVIKKLKKGVLYQILNPAWTSPLHGRWKWSKVGFFSTQISLKLETLVIHDK